MSWFSKLFGKNERGDTVRFYNVETKQITKVPRGTLGPGMIQANVEGIEGVVWVDSTKLEQSPVQDIHIDEETRGLIKQIQQTFAEHRPMSLAEWEDGFKRDQDPEREIAIWLFASEKYAEHAAHFESAAEREDVYACIITCLTSDRAHVLDIVQPKVLPTGELKKIIDSFFGTAAT